MTKEKLRTECSRLFACKTISDSNDLLAIYAEFLFKVVQNHHKEEVYLQADADAKLVVQMMLTKVLHLKEIVKGISYQAKDGGSLNRIIDPTIVASLIRNLVSLLNKGDICVRVTNQIIWKRSWLLN